MSTNFTTSAGDLQFCCQFVENLAFLPELKEAPQPMARTLMIPFEAVKRFGKKNFAVFVPINRPLPWRFVAAALYCGN
ncbi:hypothetical protein [Marinobacter sp.]|uniref:hypothetical protein n=1 Tax=Marinobacter sp. TaxID=50741 RepID=UPI00356AFB03